MTSQEKEKFVEEFNLVILDKNYKFRFRNIDYVFNYFLNFLKNFFPQKKKENADI